MILVITSKRDGHVEAVSKYLNAGGADWVRLNIEDFARNIEIVVEPTTGSGRILVKDSCKKIDLGLVQAVWYRKPDPVDLSHFRLGQGALDYVEAELTEVIHGLYALLRHAYWINDPFTTKLAHRKMLQLRVAADAGFAVPRTLVTNRADEALRFARALPGDLAIKSLGALSVIEKGEESAIQFGIFTRRIAVNELEAFADKVAHMPTLFQEFIEKAHEIRITCVGSSAFACRIEPRSGDLTSDDYRFDTKNLGHSVTDCPALSGPMRAYMQAFGLNFGCFDFAVTPTGKHIFLECNPNGQWLWVENLTGLPIGKAIADDLLLHCA